MSDDPQDLAEMTDGDMTGADAIGADAIDVGTEPLPADDRAAVGHLAHDPGDDEATAWEDEDADGDLSAEEAAIHLTADPPLGRSDGYLDGER